MEIKILNEDFTVCKLPDLSQADLTADYYFIGKTDEELSLVCRTKSTPANAVIREDGWKAFRIEGVLDFSLIGILAEISAILAQEKIGIFVVSTYNTDYVLTKKEDFAHALKALGEKGYRAALIPANRSN